MKEKKKTLVLGASDNPARYSYLAIQRLRSLGHPVLAIGRKNTTLGDVIITKDVTLTKENKEFTGIDTITLYLNQQHQREYYDYILSLQPRRIIFNPGAENAELVSLATQNGIQALEACTL